MKKRVLSLFSGCGGLDLGFEGGFNILADSYNPKLHPDWVDSNIDDKWIKLRTNNFETVFANDINPAAKYAWEKYFSKRRDCIDSYVLESVVDLVKKAECGERNIFPPDIDIVTGGFPCQDFSLAGKKRGFNSHRSHNGGYFSSVKESSVENRGMLYIWMKHVIEINLPKLFIAENVKGLVNIKNAKKTIETDFMKIGKSGYIIHSFIFNACDYGVPQQRNRIIFVGLRKDCLRRDALKALTSSDIPDEYSPFPKPSHTLKNSNSYTDQNLLPHVTVRQALFDLPEPEISIDASHRAYSKAKWYGRHCQGNTEVRLDAPSPTIRAEHHGNIEFRRLSKEHGGQYYDELKAGFSERRLSVRECARLQTFPDDYEFVKLNGNSQYSCLTTSNGYKLIGNAVPPLVAYHIAAQLQKKWDLFYKDN